MRRSYPARARAADGAAVCNGRKQDKLISWSRGLNGSMSHVRRLIVQTVGVQPRSEKETVHVTVSNCFFRSRERELTFSSSHPAASAGWQHLPVRPWLTRCLRQLLLPDSPSLSLRQGEQAGADNTDLTTSAPRLRSDSSGSPSALLLIQPPPTVAAFRSAVIYWRVSARALAASPQALVARGRHCRCGLA
jgi:hypothetical protein